MVSLLTMDFPMIKRASCSRMPYSSTAPASPPEIAKKRGRFIQRIAMMTRKTRQSFSIRMFILNLPYPLFICRPIKAWAPSRASAPENAGIHSLLSPGSDAKRLS